MPISPENMTKYPGGSIRSPEWRAIVFKINARSGGKCEKCAAPNGSVICRGIGSHAGTYMLEDGTVFDAETGERLGRARGSEYCGRFVKVVLTVAHLNHDVADSSDANLKHWCQRCHNRHDAPHRRANAAKARHRAKGADLFEGTR